MKTIIDLLTHILKLLMKKKLSKVKVTKYLKYVQLLKAKTKTNEKFLQRKFVEKNKAKWEGTFEPPKTKSL